MRKPSSRAGLMLTAMIAFACSIGSTYLSIRVDEPRTSLTVDRPVRDIGRVPQNTESTVSFNLVNSGPNAITITEVVKQCGCTDVALSKEQLKPGEAAVLTATWNTEGRRYDTTVSIYVYYKDETNPLPRVEALSISGYVQPEVVWDPETLLFDAREPSHQIVRVSNPTGRAIEIADVYASTKAISVARHPEAGTTFTVTFNPALWSPSRGSTATLTVVTDQQEHRRYLIPVRVAQ